MRGTQLRNTDYILGVAAYTGQDTKMSQNSKINANKFSSVERTLNFCFMAYLCLLLVEVILCLSFEAGFSLEADTGDGGGGHTRPRHWYLTARPQSMQSVLSDGVSYLILFSYIIPASLYVTLEVSASKSSIRRFVITEKAPTRAFSWLKAATTAFTFMKLLRHYAKRALTQRFLNWVRDTKVIRDGRFG